MPVTCGSIGDIIAVSLLVKDLVTALNQSRGSQAEYSQLVDELNLLKDVLDRIVHLCKTAGTTTAVRTFEVSALHDATLQIAQHCGKCIEGFNIRLKKYDKTLGFSGARSKRKVCKAVVAQIRWQLGGKEEVVRFRAGITSQTAALNLALTATTWSVGQDTQDILVRFGDATGDELQVQHGTLSKLSSTVTETNALASRTSLLASRTNVLVSKTNLLSGQIVDKLASHSQAHYEVLFKMILSLQTSLPGYAQRSLFGESFVLEDAIGRICPVHLQFISSWEALDAVLEIRFRGIQGHEKVQSGHWTLQDHATGRDISRARSWEGAFLPGQRVEMSMLFHGGTNIDSSAQVPASNKAACPRCQADVSESRDVETRCNTCGLCFRRIVELEEVDPVSMHSAPKPSSDMPSCESKFGPVTSKTRREADELNFSGFKRIQIVSRVNEVERHVSRHMLRNASASRQKGMKTPGVRTGRRTVQVGKKKPSRGITLQTSKKAKRNSARPAAAVVAGPSMVSEQFPAFNTREGYEHWVADGLFVEAPKPRREKVSSIAAWMAGAPVKPAKKVSGIAAWMAGGPVKPAKKR